VTQPREHSSAPAEPAPMTDADVEAMVRGGAPSLARRIARHSPSKRTGKLSDEKAAPTDVTATEMSQIQRQGRLPTALRKRLGAAPSDEPAEPLSSRMQSPERRPTP
jgi:hypothetical protein